MVAMADNQKPALAETSSKSGMVDRFYDPKPGPNSESLTFSEAARLYNVSVTTLRRRRDAGELEGAHKVPTPSGDAWVVPIETLQNLGYVLRTEEEAEPSANQAALAELTEVVARQASQVEQVIQALTAVMQSSTNQLEAAQADRNQTMERAIRAEEQAREAKAQAERMEAELEAAKKQMAEMSKHLKRSYRRTNLDGQ